MRSLVGLLILVLTFFCSCQEKTTLSNWVPNDAVAVGKINLPAIKSKVMTWEQIKKYLFSDDEGDQQLDWSIDLTRQIIFCALDERNAQLIVPINSGKTFGKAAKKTFGHQVNTQNDFNYLQSDHFYVGWKSDFAIFSLTDDFLHSAHRGANTLTEKTLHSSHDIFMQIKDTVRFDTLVTLDLSSNFDDGRLDIILHGNEALTRAVDTLYSPQNQLETFALATDSCVAEISTQVKKKYLLFALNSAMPFLQENGLLFQDQLEGISQYLDGRVYLGVSTIKLEKEKRTRAKIALGTVDTFPAYFHDQIANGLLLDELTGFLTDQEGFQFIKQENNKIIYSNHNDPNTSFIDPPGLLNMRLNRTAVEERFLAFPKMLFGSEAVDNFPIQEVEMHIGHQDKKIEANLLFRFHNPEQNSLISLMDYAMTILNKDEI